MSQIFSAISVNRISQSSAIKALRKENTCNPVAIRSPAAHVVANFYINWLFPLPPQSSSLIVTWNAVSWNWSPKTSHRIKHNSQLSDWEYFIKLTHLSEKKKKKKQKELAYLPTSVLTSPSFNNMFSIQISRNGKYDSSDLLGGYHT